MRRGGQGEALAVWAVWLLTLLAVIVTSSRIDAAELYNVAGRRSQPRAQPRGGAHHLAVCARRDRARARGDAGPAAPRLVARRAGDRALRDDAAVRQPVAPQRALGEPRPRRRRRARARPAVAASRAPVARSSRGFPAIPSTCPRRGRARPLAALDLAELGFHLPGDVFMGQELFRRAEGQLEAAVHLGEHHGWHGSLMLLSALVLSRVQAVAGSGSAPDRRLRHSRPTAPSTPPRTSGRSSSSSAAPSIGRSRARSIPALSR